VCVLDLEYTICQIQSGKFSIAAKSLRKAIGRRVEIQNSGLP